MKGILSEDVCFYKDTLILYYLSAISYDWSSSSILSVLKLEWLSVSISLSVTRDEIFYLKEVILL